ncbi:MFS transporter [Shimazuella kribbensis]|uniref:MFS transporter n=1 Tax=Shimazuella kribbensis TaxID=139808 RepID=UPI003CCC0661
MSHRKLLWLAGLGFLFDSMDVGILSFVLAALKTDWHLSVQEIGWIGSVNSIGMAVGAFVFGLLADRIGRKPVFMITLLLFSVASGLSALTTTLWAFICLRFIMGMGLGGELPVATTLVSESVPAEKRGRMVVLLESFWAVGWLVAAVISYFVIPQYGWQIAMIITALPAFYVLYLRSQLPNEMEKKRRRNKLGVWESIRKVWSPPYRKQTLVLWILWFCVVFSYYGLFLWLPSVLVLKGFTLIKSFQYVLIMTLAQLPGYFTVAWLIERLGRKPILVIFLLGTAISSYFFGNADTMSTLLISGVLLSYFHLGVWGATYAYTPEQYPDEIKATGAGMASAFGRIGGIGGPLLIGYLVATKMNVSSIFTIFSVATIIATLTVLVWGKESKAITVMETKP